MFSKSDQIIRLRTENPILRLTQIADKVGVRKSYAHKVLAKAALPTKSVLINKKHLPKRVVCRACNGDVSKATESHSARVHHIHDACRYEYFNIIVNCRFCRVVFRRKRNLIIAAAPFSTYIYCGRTCYEKGMKNDSTYDLRITRQKGVKNIDSD
jgi:predicted DNA-binding transcriptional regulator AlpA